MTLDEYRGGFRSGYFRDCCVRRKDIFVFIFERSLTDEEVEEEEANGYDPSLRPKGVVSYIRSEPVGRQWFKDTFYGWESIITGAAQKPLNQSINAERTAVFPSMEKRVFVTGSGPAYQDESLGEEPSKDFLRGGYAA